jgi:hypothetical protein
LACPFRVFSKLLEFGATILINTEECSGVARNF